MSNTENFDIILHESVDDGRYCGKDLQMLL